MSALTQKHARLFTDLASHTCGYLYSFFLDSVWRPQHFQGQRAIKIKEIPQTTNISATDRSVHKCELYIYIYLFKIGYGLLELLSSNSWRSRSLGIVQVATPQAGFGTSRSKQKQEKINIQWTVRSTSMIHTNLCLGRESWSIKSTSSEERTWHRSSKKVP